MSEQEELPQPPPMAPEHLYLVSPEMAQVVADEQVRSFGQPRASGWTKLSREWIGEHPDCAVCGTKSGCVPHHIFPVHKFPDRELDKRYLITLCPPHHLLIGHGMNWRLWNRHVVKDAKFFRNRIAECSQTAR